MYIRINCYLTVNSLTLLIGERTENRRFMSLCQEKDIFGTKQKIIFLCQNSICLYVFMFLGMLHFEAKNVVDEFDRVRSCSGMTGKSCS